MEEAIKKTLKSLKARNLTGWCVENCQEARGLMLDLIPQDARVGRGNSSTIDQIGIMESLEKRGTYVFVPSDLKSVAPGNAVHIVFDALPDLSFPGRIVSVDPVLVNVDGMPAVQSYASIDLSTYPVPSAALGTGGTGTLLSGMNATVEVVAGEARNAVLVPIQALQELPAKRDSPGAPSQYIVYVLARGGTREKRVVTVGLQDYVNAEILSGLEPGEEVLIATEKRPDPTEKDSGKSKPAPVRGK